MDRARVWASWIRAKCLKHRVVLLPIIGITLGLVYLHFQNDGMFDDLGPADVEVSSYAQGLVRFADVRTNSTVQSVLAGLSYAVVYQAIGEGSMREAIHSARTLREVEGDGFPRIVVTDETTIESTKPQLEASGKEWPFTRTTSVYEIIKESGEKRRKEAEEAGVPYVPDEEDDALSLIQDMTKNQETTYGCKRVNCETSVVRAIRISRMRLILAMLNEFDMIIFVDSDTHMCRSLTSLFAEAHVKKADMFIRQVPVVKELDADWKVGDDIPSDFPEAWGGMVLFRSTPKTKATLGKWLEFYKAYHGEAHPTSDQAHLREALWHAKPKFWEFGPEYGCPLFVRKADECLGGYHLAETKEEHKLRGNHATEWKKYVHQIDEGPYPCAFIHAHMVFDE